MMKIALALGLISASPAFAADKIPTYLTTLTCQANSAPPCIYANSVSRTAVPMDLQACIDALKRQGRFPSSVPTAQWCSAVPDSTGPQVNPVASPPQ